MSFGHAGSCVIDANEAGDTDYSPAPQAQQQVDVSRLAQQITFTSTPPDNAVPGGSYLVAATGGGSANPVTFTIDATSAGVCTVTNHGKSSTGRVKFIAAGLCVIDADEAGNAYYAPAPVAQQKVIVWRGRRRRRWRLP